MLIGPLLCSRVICLYSLTNTGFFKAITIFSIKIIRYLHRIFIFLTIKKGKGFLKCD